MIFFIFEIMSGAAAVLNKWRYSNLRLSAEKILDTDVLTVSVNVTNTGARPGKEVVQLYVSDVESTLFRPLRELKGFEKIYLAPNETKTVSFTLNKRAFATWNTQIQDWYVESGAFLIQICKNSRDIILEAQVQVTGTAELPIHFTMDSIMSDVLAHPRGAQVMSNMNVFGELASEAAEAEQQSDAASGAITNKMMEAMQRYSPLRSLVTFSNGQMTFEQLDALLSLLNGEQKAE